MVLPIILGVACAVLAIGWIVTWFGKRPTIDNDTMRDIKKNFKLEEENKAKEKDRERKDKENERRHKEAMEKIKLDREKAEAEREKARSRLAELAAEERKQNEERKNKTAQDVKEAAKEAQRLNAKDKEREKRVKEEQRKLQEYEKEMKEKEQALEEEIRKANELVEKEREARMRAENGRQQDRWPTREEYEKGRELIQYRTENLHFAIIGKSGSGKSSLINAFLDYGVDHPDAAQTGITETTSKIARYPDRGEQAPRPWTVWYDVPGAGTQNVSAWQYFINQGLFVFDVILIAIGDRFEETDVQLLRDCHRFKIPALIVRSKADMHIDNLIKTQGEWRQRAAVTPETVTYQRCRDRFVTESKQMVRDELAKAGLPDQEVYLVSSFVLREVYNCSLNGIESNLPPEMIDEKTLIRALMLLTIQRRGGDKALQVAIEIAMKGDTLARKTAEVARNVSTKIQEHPMNPFGRRDHPAHVDDDTAAEMDEVQPPQQDTNNTKPMPRRPNSSNQRGYIKWTRKVIHLPKPVELDQLHQELNEHNPNLAEMFAAPPGILSRTNTGKTAVLNFLPWHPIPQEIIAFGRTLPLKTFRPKGNREVQGSHRDSPPPYSSAQPASSCEPVSSSTKKKCKR